MVVHVLYSLGIGGLENGVVNLVNAAMPGVRHVIVSLTPDTALRPRLNPNVEVFTLNKRPGHDPATFCQLVRLLRSLHPDIVHSRNWGTFDAVVAARLARVRHVVHGEHGRDITDPDGLNRRRNWLRRCLSLCVSRFVTVSEDLRSWLVSGVRIPARKVIAIHNGVDATRFSPGESAPLRARLGLSRTAPVLGTVARLDPVKDQAGLIRAFGRVRAGFRDVELVIAGNGPCLSELQQLTKTLELDGAVRFLGECHNIPNVLRAMDVFVLPSIAEGISNTILEAMASGLPVVATRVGGNPELVEEGVTGMLVPPQDPERLAHAIEQYLEDSTRRRKDGTAARQRVVDCFSLDRMCDAYRRLYAELTGHVELAEYATLHVG